MFLNRNQQVWVGLICSLFLASSPTVAHQSGQHAITEDTQVMAIGSAQMHIAGDKRVITSDGLASHQTGQFPNRGNPNRISAQSISVEMPLHPVQNNLPQPIRMMGIALNGILFEPGTAECFGQTRTRQNTSIQRPKASQKPRAGQRAQRQNGQARQTRQARQGGSNACAWREEALVNGKGRLGLDSNNAHVQPSGLYHYHGIPDGLVAQLQPDANGEVHIGYAADGFPLYMDPQARQAPSYQLKSGSRPSGDNQPGGLYDGTYTADFEFRAGSGSLDECNGRMVAGQYRYYATERFPYLPRCLWGNVDNSFQKKRR
ncbi:MAG: YHYH protein [Candidatus Puniceispirillaceae bacterium]